MWTKHDVKRSRKIKSFKYLALSLLYVAVLLGALISPVYAQKSGSELDLNKFNTAISGVDQSPDGGDNCGGVKVAFSVGCRDDFSNPILAYLVALLRFLTYGVGIVIILVVVIGGIQYASAGGNAQSVSAAKLRILNAFIALLLYIFAFAILNYVVPGGLIG